METCTDDEQDPASTRIADAIDNADEASVRPLGPRSETPADIAILGERNGVCYFISSSGELRSFNPKDLGKLNIASLFGGNIAWLEANFPVTRRKTDDGKRAFDADQAAFWLMEKSRDSGKFNPNTPIRRIGVWRAGKDVVAHLGANVWHRGERKNGGCIIDGAIYTACNKLQEPDFNKPAERFDGQRIRKNLNAWSFTQEHDADLLFGFLGASFLGGFPKWRVHAIITGEGGSGKSSAGRYIVAALGPQATDFNDYSEPGIRQQLTGEGRPVWLDEGESESEEQAKRMARVISLLRKMSDGIGAKIVRGTPTAGALNSTVTGSVLITAINAPLLQPQDRSRILVVPIDKPSGDYTSDDVRLMCEEAATLSPKLRARAILGADRFSQTFDTYRKYLREHGCDERRADFFGTLLAGRSLLLDDAIPDPQAMGSYIATLRDRLNLIMVDDSDATDGQQCLNHLLDMECPAIRDGIRASIGQIISSTIDPITSLQNEKLIPIGIKLVETRTDGHVERMLFVANDHQALKRIFHNTRWGNGNWRTSLLRLPHVKPSPKPISIGRKSRGLLIPSKLLPSIEADDHLDLHHDPPPPAPQ